MVEWVVINPVVESPQASAAPAALNGLSASEIRSELEQILHSRVFLHSHRIRRFLQFVVEECLLGQQHRLKEYLIGLEVFNRLETFDPRVDSIVRVEARRLRTKLNEYYQTEGREDEIRIELRKGSYVPIFEHRSRGMNGGFSSATARQRRHSLAISRLTGLDGESMTIGEDLRRRLSHAVLKNGIFQVLADSGGSDGANGNPASEADRNDAPRPDFILEGHVERNGDGTRLVMQLLDIAENAYVWSEAVDESEVESLASSLNRSVITAAHSENARIKLRAAQNQGFDLYLQGRYLWKIGTPDSIKNSITYFSKALDRDGTYAAAWAALAEASMVTALFGYSDPRETGPKMREAALNAISQGDTLPEAHVALGSVTSAVDWQWEEGEREFQRAMQLDERDPKVHAAYAVQLACRGLVNAALAEAERALDLDPASLTINFIVGWLHGIAKRYDEAIAGHEMISRLAPDFPLAYLGLGWAHLGKGLFSDALAHFTNATNLMRGRSLLTGCLGHCYAKMNQRDEALRQLAQLTAHSPSQYSSPVSVAAVYTGLGQNDRALAALDQAAHARDCSLPMQLLNPEFDSVRGEPGFRKLLEKMGLSRSRSASAV